MGEILVRFAIRWLLSAAGLWVASRLLGEGNLSTGDRVGTLLGAGFFLAVVNAALKPIIIFLSLPAIILSLGLFMLVVNGVLIIIAHWLYPTLYVKNLGMAVLAGIIIGIVNLIFSPVLDAKADHHRPKN